MHNCICPFVSYNAVIQLPIQAQILPGGLFAYKAALSLLAGKTAVENLLTTETRVAVASPLRPPTQKKWNIAAAHKECRSEDIPLSQIEDQALKLISTEAAQFSPLKAGRGKRKAVP